jgi:hypothetical protein
MVRQISLFYKHSIDFKQTREIIILCIWKWTYVASRILIPMSRSLVSVWAMNGEEEMTEVDLTLSRRARWQFSFLIARLGIDAKPYSLFRKPIFIEVSFSLDFHNAILTPEMFPSIVHR